jgi:hypothetical protein
MWIPSLDTSTFIADVIAALALIGLIVNAKFLHNQVNAANDQVEGMSRPALVFLPPYSQEYAGTGAGDTAYFHLFNIGSGPALKITFRLTGIQNPEADEVFAHLQPKRMELIRTLQAPPSSQATMEVTYYSLGKVGYRTTTNWRNSTLQTQAIERLKA